jgi:hypothetical protein
MQFSRYLLQLPIRFDAARLADEVCALPRSAWMPHPQGFEGNDAVPLVSVGGGLNDEFVGPMAATEHLNRMPYVASLMAELNGVWGRSRLMGLGAGAVVPQHVDIHYYWRTHIRIHVPVITNPGVRFFCGGEDVHMRPGEAWVFDSFRMHEVRNEGSEKRVHLVLDTVGSSRIWELIEAANAGAKVPDEPWRPSGGIPELHFERMNQPVVMSPWEMRCHVDYLLENTVAAPNEAILRAIDRFIFTWQTTWTEYGESEVGWPAYRELIRFTCEELSRVGAAKVMLNNEASLYRALDALILSRALMPARPQPATASSNPKAA